MVGTCIKNVQQDKRGKSKEDKRMVEGSHIMPCCFVNVSLETSSLLEGATWDFVQRLDRQLHLNTFLVQNVASVVDVVLVQMLAGILFGTTASASTFTKLPLHVHRWMTTVLHKLQACFPYRSMAGGWRSIGLQRDNIWQMWLEQLETKCTIVESTAVAVEPTTTTTTTAPTTKPQETTSVKNNQKQKKTETPAVAATPTPAAKAETPSSVSDDDSNNPILQKLQASGVPFELYNHAACHTAEELVQNVPLPDASHSHTKNLFVRDKKHGHFLVTLAATNTTFSTKFLATALKLKGKTNLRLADAAILQAKLQVKPGCVGPLCMALAKQEEDSKENVTLVLDQSLLSCTKIHSHALRNDASVQLTPDDFQSFLTKHCNVTPVLVDFGASATGGESSDAAPAKAKPQEKKVEAPKSKAPSKAASTVSTASSKKSNKKGETLLALQWKKLENFASWYSDVIVLSEMISYYDISGCYILRPWSYKMWELIQYWFNDRIQELGVENAYFPLFVSQDRLEREKDHVEGFAPEVAWVTKSGSGDLAQPIAVRPTSETIMYPAYSDWIQSHRDLPLKLNQWSNVVRWEFKYPTPFLRTREFLWQEGHTAHATYEEADEMVMQALDLYRRVYEELLAVPVVPGYKTEKEKFAGGYRTTTVEAYIAGSGRAIQGATSHNLGQNFGKMFDINFQNDKGESQVPWQTSWGLTTRTIGVMVMVHGDDTGLVLPPRVAPLQVVIVPIVSKKFTREQAAPYCEGILQDLQQQKIRVKYDDRSLYNPGWKYNHWEQKGVPIRIEVGPRDVDNKSARIVIRHNQDKQDMPVDGLGKALVALLETIQQDMFTKAEEARDSHVVQVTDWKDFVPNLEKHNLVLTPWCGGKYEEWEDTVKEKSRQESLAARGEDAEDEKTSTSVAAKTLCIPFDQPELPAGTKCIISGMDATCWVLWGRSY